ncbi:MAG: hypothetical protein PXX77_10400 [Gallionella sp.]|nr:hypothetical protein [Gallionella sp.]
MLSGTPIFGSASVNYVMGASPVATATSNTISFVVDEKVNLTVVGGNITNVISGATLQVATFTVTNNSNSPLDFSLAINSTIAADAFDPTACNAYVENGVTAGFQSGQDTATFIDELAVDTTKTVYAVCNIPLGQANTNTGQVGLVATAQGNFTGVTGAGALHAYVPTPGTLGAALTPTSGVESQPNVDIVFVDIQGSETALDTVRDAKHSARDTYSVGPALVLTKSVSVVDPKGTAVVMPGAVMTYTINATLTGTSAVNNLTIADPLPANITYVPGSIQVACGSGTYANGVCGTGVITSPQSAAAKTDTNMDADFADFTANTVSVSLGNVAAPANVVITFRATIN